MIKSKQLLQVFTILFSFIFITSACKTFIYQKNNKVKNFALRDIVPLDNEISGWDRDGEMIYCQDLVCLASLIDGAAPYYIDGGAFEIIFQDFKKPPENTRMTLEIYRTKNNSQAKELYKGSSSISPVQIENHGEEGRLDQGLIGSYRAEIFKENLFIRIVSMDKNESLKNDILEFIKKITSKIPR